MTIREFNKSDIEQMLPIWNEVIRADNAFPQDSELKEGEAFDYFSSQSFTGVAEDGGKIVGVYILHPNNIGKCSHIANASYAVDKACRGKGIGRAIVSHCLQKCAELGFGILQFNAVVASNKGAIKLYEDMGFVRLGTVEDGYRHNNGEFEDIVLFYRKV
ncbi:MAG: GNAT family N-acetyltransferase [Ruminococcus sp.]|nr:GNAT family N-acetyltransferase [Ruminococcus sp.]